jgi:hypothetical protein
LDSSFWFENLSKSEHQTSKQSSITPSFTDFLDAISDPAESGFQSIDVQG